MLLTAVDDRFLDEASYLIRSCARHMPEQRFYLFLVNSTETRVAPLKAIHPNLMVEHVSWEFDAERWRGLMCSARSIPISHVLETYQEPTIYLDSDTMLRTSLDGLFQELEAHDVLIKYRPQLEQIGPVGTPHAAKFNSGVIAIRPSEAGLAFMREYHTNMRAWIEAGKPILEWREEYGVHVYIDQEFLFLAYDKLKDQMKFKALPEIYNDAGFHSNSVIWHGKGSARTHPEYTLAKLSYDRGWRYLVLGPLLWGMSFARSVYRSFTSSPSAAKG